MPKRFNVKIDPLIYLENWQIQSQVEIIRHLIELKEKQGVVTLQLLKRVKEEGESLQRTLQFYGIKLHWTELI